MKIYLGNVQNPVSIITPVLNSAVQRFCIKIAWTLNHKCTSFIVVPFSLKLFCLSKGISFTSFWICNQFLLCFRGKYRVLYITPEYASSGGVNHLKDLDREVGLDLIAIDEAHCVSQWGHDFRSAYRSLGQLKEAFPQVCTV